MKKLIFVLAIMLMSIFAYSQEILTATRVVKSRGAEVEYVIPDEFFSERPILSRGGCIVKIDNWTGYYVDMWVNKNYKGRLNPWENSQLILNEEIDEIYCKTMGESYQWKSNSGECNNQIVLGIDEEDDE